jgi:hypothetical protein
MLTLPATYKNNPPISPSLKTFYLCIGTLYSFHTLNLILHCMPNLRQFFITIIISSSLASTMWTNVIMGNEWQRLLTINTFQLDILDIFLFVVDTNIVPDMNVIIKSFDYFARKYDDWSVAIHRSRRTFNDRGKIEQITIY